MRHVDGVYTQWFNRRHKSDGSLMRGRFRSRVVQEEAYVAEVVRYIHTNPLGPGLAGTAADYRWSSHRVYLGQEKRPWCCHRMTLELIGFDVGDHVEAFDAFVHERVDPEREEQLATAPVRLESKRHDMSPLAGGPWEPIGWTEECHQVLEVVEHGHILGCRTRLVRAGVAGARHGLVRAGLNQHLG